ncbi:NAD(P)/FAD-dependent oxidoreductase [Marinoscillum sp. MHG1-6]|uniref:FAD-dependent oxidoreductase n=1 Tax=Marinoscillum sp. MHG1-6 TaxID=2959627 RepID=UPI0021582F68|nr:NAD(P)/FAD-dependent oxidoreductase [Marinoscillum sp. MHG1-6]
MRRETINILGGGPVGSLLSLMLTQKGYSVKVFEKRSDPRKTLIHEGRSINLALSHRGIHALKEAGVFDSVRHDLIPMEGRMMHDLQGELNFQAYGKEGQAINSISRAKLNRILCDEAEKAGVEFFFNHKCVQVDTSCNRVLISYEGQEHVESSDILIGADGAFSSLRKAYELDQSFKSKVTSLGYGYKELNLVPENDEFVFEPNYLHIWPRGEFMLIALPNPDKTFTCTLFLSLEGKRSFAQLDTDERIDEFFKTNFPDVYKIAPNLIEQFHRNPTSNLHIVETECWSKNNSMIIGDAAHAIVPFYGQGMNAGFEDCRLLIKALEAYKFDWEAVLETFHESRKADTDAISTLALTNFIEMRDKVASQTFLNRKKVEARLQQEFPVTWLPLYSMVTFSDLPYSQCLNIGRLQQKALDTLEDISDPENIDLKPVIDYFNDLVLAYQQAH